jgi:pyruvate/2-oxoglutarate/acetoin dehydrogenase E1 component
MPAFKGPIKKIKKGSDCTVVSMSYSTIEIIKIYETLKKNGFSIDHFDVNIIRPLQVKNIFNSLKKTGKLLILDNSSHKFCYLNL